MARGCRGWTGTRASTGALRAWVVAISAAAAWMAPASGATPLPDEWPLAPPPAPSPASASPEGRPRQPDTIPALMAVADLAPAAAQRLALPARATPEPWLHPLPVAADALSPWGWRWSAARQAWRMHTGVDLLVPAGTPVQAARSGLVLLAEDVGAYGLTVLIDHGDGWQTLYAHLEVLAVAPGARVGQGQRLGRVGATGNATAPHLHLELRQRRGGEMVALDPAVLLSAPRPVTAELAAERGR